MSFVAPEPETALDPIANIEFFPEIDPAAVKDAMRLDGTVTNPRLREALVQGMAWANRELRAWREARQAEGYATLGAVPGDSIGGESERLAHYRRAVYSYAASTLTERYRGYDSSAKGDRKADSNEPTIDDLARDARWAIRDIVGLPRTVVELI